ncbi:MAG TPA: hypothetical protein P5274_01205 [Candidatus Paceibacterota bacterium]|nr:hypothetical protein [Candidatus Paceibacterota bacterium]
MAEKRVLLLSPNPIDFHNNESGGREGDEGVRVFVAQGKAFEHLADPIKVIRRVWNKVEEGKFFPIDLAVVFLGDDNKDVCFSVGKLMEHKVSPDRVIFVFCFCRESFKERILEENGYGSSRVINCDCGGHQEMGKIYRQAMLGILP